MLCSFSFWAPLLLAWTLFATLSSAAKTVSSTILVLARDATSGTSGTAGLNAYGIPYELVIVPQAGTTLPILSTANTTGNYGGIIVVSEVSYGYDSGWASALTTAQWQQMYSYQTVFGVRMVRLDVYPTPDFGVTTAIAGAGCCGSGVEQLLSFTNATGFKTAGLVTGAGVSTQGLWHYPATITDSSTTYQIAQFAAGGSFTSASTAAVINNFPGRQQMVWFISWASDWSTTSNYIMHAHIHWMTRGLYLGRRRIYFGTQIDDMHLSTGLYQPANTTFRLRPADLTAHVAWQANLNSRLPKGSSYFVEIGHNGNGNIQAAVNADTNNRCNPANGIDYTGDLADTTLEFQKPLGSGSNIWPTTPTAYGWSTACSALDPLAAWFQVAANRNAFAHISHTFTHESLDNATYSDASKEIQFNQAWLKQMGFTSGKFSPNGLIPPAITGLHNGDVIKAWMDNGLKYAVGDNSRPVLMSTQSPYWPLISTVAGNGYAGLTIIPRWSNPIYYNCDMPACTSAEWVATSGGWGDFNSLLDFSRATYTRPLFALRQDPFMFHQANLRQGDTPSTTVGTKSGNLSLLQIFVETILQEMMRLTTWPIITLTHDQLGVAFNNRMTLDNCVPKMTYNLSVDGKSITSVTVTATGNTCSVPIPVTFPVNASPSPACGCTTNEQFGTDPLTSLTTLKGAPVTFALSSPVVL